MSDSTRTPEEVGRLWFERMWDRRELDLIRELLAENAVGHLEGGEEVVGPEAFARFQEEAADDRGAPPLLALPPLATSAPAGWFHGNAGAGSCAFRPRYSSFRMI